MNSNDKHRSHQRTINYPRRSSSVDNSIQQIVTDNEDEVRHKNQMTIHKKYTKESDHNDCICVPLLRSNNQPIAKTCWLVCFFYIFSSIISMKEKFTGCRK